jgi:hypothetical protein
MQQLMTFIVVVTAEILLSHENLGSHPASWRSQQLNPQQFGSRD